VKLTIPGLVLVACLALCLAPEPLVLAAAAPPRGDFVEALTFQASKEGAIIALKTSVPVPRFKCTLAKTEPRQVVIDFPAAKSGLKKRYALDSPLVREALVEKSPQPGQGLRIRLTLGEGILAAVELAGQGLTLQFQEGAPAPIQEAAEPAEYLVGAGDKLEISIFGHPDLNRTLEVRGDGTIDFPLIGDVPVAGKGLPQIGREMTLTLGKKYLVDPQVSVNVKEYGSQWVTVMGEVRTPGRHLLRRKMRLIDLLAEAGGLTAFANRKQIEILRTESNDLRRKLVVNLKEVEDGKKPDLPLMASDVVIVPRRTF
jgi:protein involved in polysaccharide export with SLBB domain